MKIDNERHTYTCDACKTHTRTFFDSSRGNAPVATVLSIIVKIRSPRWPAAALGPLLSHECHQNTFSSFTPDSLDAASLL